MADAPVAAPTPPAPPVDASGLEPVLVEPDVVRNADGLPVVTVSQPAPRQQAILILDDQEWLVTAPKTMYAVSLMENLQEIMAHLGSKDDARRGQSLRDLRTFLTCVFSRIGHPSDDIMGNVICGDCDACRVLAILRRPDGVDLDNMVAAFADLMAAWGLQGNRAQRRAAAKG